MSDVAIAFFIGLVIGGCGGVFALALCIMSGKNEPRDDYKERLISCGIRKGEKMNVSKAEYEVKTTMTNDLLKVEEYINSLGVETRKPDNDDEFRSMYDVLSDIVTVWNNNPTIGKDVETFLAGNHETSDELDEFLSHYNLDGIMRNR